MPSRLTVTTPSWSRNFFSVYSFGMYH